MRKLAGFLVLGVALFLPQATSAATTRESFDVTGTVFPCQTHMYTITCGAITSVMHESVDATGTTHFTVTETPDRVSFVDENGNTPTRERRNLVRRP